MKRKQAKYLVSLAYWFATTWYNKNYPDNDGERTGNPTPPPPPPPPPTGDDD